MIVQMEATPGIGVLRLPGRFALERGAYIEDARIGYEIAGRCGPVVIVLGGISAGRHVTAHAGDPRRGWWEELAGPGRALDTDSIRVLSTDWLGGVGTSSGPGVNGVTTGDQARAITAVLDHLNIACADAVVGASYGGMVALALAAAAPTRVMRTIGIAAAERSHPMATALRSLQRRVVRLGMQTGRVTDALAIARALAMTTYRSAAEFAERFATTPIPGTEPARFEVEAYLEYCGQKFARDFSAHAFLRLSESIDLHEVDPAAVTVPTSLIAFDTDVLVPATQLRALHERLPWPAGFLVIPSIYGHDAFLKETVAMSDALKDALNHPLEVNP
jgi:homoserine O-acetyltransferase